ncbi:MAG: histidinol phosphate phosphatase domain-containing protein [Thermodesulfobacteriota bacterium]
MIDLHIHSTFSDGELIPAEVVSRATAAGYTALAITDHADPSNLELILENMGRFCRAMAGAGKADVFPGVELTHVPPRLIPYLVERSRELGAKVVVVHGETIVEPVPRGTNLAAIRAGADILAHPGLLTEAEARLARKNGVFLEITARKGHSLTNGHVARMAVKTGARMVYNTDSHSPGDFTPWDAALRIIRGASLTERDALRMQENARRIVER